MSYTNQEIINTIKKGLTTPGEVYKLDAVNYRGESKEKEKYTELIAEYLCKNINELKLISSINRDKTYKISTHDGKVNNPNSNRTEELMAKKMYHCVYKAIGKVEDYQVPLKNVRDDKGVGKIDLLSEQGDVLTIIELKKHDSNETLLRAVLEAFTYFKLVDQQKLLSEYTATKLEKAVLIYENGKAYMEYLNLPNTNIKELMRLLNVKLYVYSINDPYTVANLSAEKKLQKVISISEIK